MTDLKKYEEFMDKCSHCAFCQAVCPVFLEDLLETHVARARMEIIRKNLLDEKSPTISQRTKEIIDRCLLCGMCRKTCPAGVPVDDIVIAARSALNSKGRWGIAERFIIRQIMEKRGISGLMGKAGSLFKTLGIAPRDLPEIPEKPLREIYSGTIPARGKTTGRVAYFVGCATNSIYTDTGVDTIEVLTRNGIEVIIPNNIVCCGIPALGEGDMETFNQMAEKNISTLKSMEVDAIVTDCTSCTMVLKEKTPELASGDMKEAALSVAGKVIDLMEYIGSKNFEIPESERTFTCHQPCHGSEPDLLSSLPGYRPMEESGSCCGAGGSFFLKNKNLSSSIREKKLARITETEADVVLTPCPSCRSYIGSGTSGFPKVIHPISFLAESYRRC